MYRTKGEARLRVHPKSVQKLKDKGRQVTGRSNGMGIEERKTRLKQLIRRWVNYLRLADMAGLMQQLDKWTRWRIRMVTWKRWNRIRTRFENLKRLGAEKQAWMWANTRKGYWRIAKSPILKIALSNERFRRTGYLSFSDYYSSVKA
ncbi:group II intron maturase-specific domain-containing protein [Candidatus Darwinibacter acetoxidans]